MRIAQIQIKRKVDLERALGGNVAKTVLGFRESAPCRLGSGPFPKFCIAFVAVNT